MTRPEATQERDERPLDGGSAHPAPDGGRRGRGSAPEGEIPREPPTDAVGWIPTGVALAAVVAAASGCDPAVQEEHVLDRLGFGADAWTRQRLRTLGVEGYVREQLDPASIDDPELDARLGELPSLAMSFRELLASYPGPLGSKRRPLAELTHATLLRALSGRRQLEAVLMGFWLDHFNVFGPKGLVRWGVVPFERSVRRHALGSFRELLVSVARSPAMLEYLDNHKSQVWSRNENYARELLELHTVGVEAGYDQRDVVDVARCFTGWAMDLDGVPNEDGFGFRAPAHDTGEKRVMDLRVPAGGGVEDGMLVLEYLARHPATARRIARKLVRRFVNESEPARLVDHVAEVFLATDGDLRAVVEAVLLSAEFLGDMAHRRSKVKRPFVLVASLLRTLGIRPEEADRELLLEDLESLGEPPFRVFPPDGTPDDSRYWAANGALVRRFQLVRAIAEGERGATAPLAVAGESDGEIADALVQRFVPDGVSAGTRAGLLDLAALLPPELPREERVREMAALLLSSPEFMRH